MSIVDKFTMMNREKMFNFDGQIVGVVREIGYMAESF